MHPGTLSFYLPDASGDSRKMVHYGHCPLTDNIICSTVQLRHKEHHWFPGKVYYNEGDLGSTFFLIDNIILNCFLVCLCVKALTFSKIVSFIKKWGENIYLGDSASMKEGGRNAVGGSRSIYMSH